MEGNREEQNLEEKKVHTDGYKNLMNKYGTKEDMSEQYRFESDIPVTDMELTLNYEENGLFTKIIDIPAEDAVSSGFSYGINDMEMEDFINNSLDELDFEEKIATAIKWARLYGGSLVVMMIDDGRQLEEPIDWDGIQGIDELLVFERSVVTPDYNSIYQYKPDKKRSSQFGMPEFYEISPTYGRAFRVHESRCLLFKNGILPSTSIKTEYRFFGIPEYVRIHRNLQETVTSHGNGVKLLDRAVQAIYKMKHLAELLATEDGEDKVLTRLRMIDMAKGILNSIAIDSEGEEYEYKNVTFSGIKDILDSTCNMLSAVTNIPQTKLFGRSPAGENSTGKGDMENYYKFVEKIQKLNLKNNVRTLIDIILIVGKVKGKYQDISGYKLKFNPLWSLSEAEQADVDRTKAETEHVKAQTAQIYVDMQALDASEVRNRLAESEEFSVNDILEEEDCDWKDIMTQEVEGESEKTSNTALSTEYETDDRDYKKEYREYQGKPEQIHNRVLRNKARKEMGLKVGDPREVDHKIPLSKGGSNLKRNLEVTSRTENRKKGNKTDENETKNIPIVPTGCGVLVVKNGKILVGNRKDNGLVCGSGGHIEEGEIPEEAAIRETREEFGIYVAELIPIAILTDMPEEYCDSQIFLCTEYFGEPVAFNSEMEYARFESIHDLMLQDLFLPFELSVQELLHQLHSLNMINKDGWITVNGRHIEVNEKGELMKGNPKVLGGMGKDKEKSVSSKKENINSKKQQKSLKKEVNSGTVYAEKKIDDFIANPKSLGDTTHKEKYDDFKKNGVDVKSLARGSHKNIPYENGGGYRVTVENDGKYLQYHPKKSSHHGGEYYKLSSGKSGTKRYSMEGEPQEEGKE